MYPSIRDRDILIVRPVHPSELRIGEVVFYTTASKAVAHRLISARRGAAGRTFLLQGDRSVRPDPPIRGDQILGRVVEVSRKGRKIQLETSERRFSGLLWALTTSIRPLLYPFLRRARGAVSRQVEFLPIERLLLLLAKTGLEEREMDEMVRLVHLVDGEELIQKTILHGVAPAAYLHLKKLNRIIPEAILARFRQIYLSNLRHNLKLRAELRKIVSLLNGRGIEPIPLKGVFLAEHIHKDLGLRPSSDLDLLVRREDLPLVIRELHAAGYGPSSSYSERFIQRFLRHQAFVRRDSPSNGMCVEVHWNFFPRLLTEFDISRVWRNSISKRLGNARLLTLSPEDTLLYLAITLRLHGYIGLKLFADLCQLLRVEDRIDWDHVIREAENNQQRVGLYYALRFAKDLFAAEVPERITARLGPSPFHKGLISLILNQRKILRPVRGRLRKIHWDLVRLATMDHPLTILRILGRTLILHPEEVYARHRIQ